MPPTPSPCSPRPALPGLWPTIAQDSQRHVRVLVCSGREVHAGDSARGRFSGNPKGHGGRPRTALRLWSDAATPRARGSEPRGTDGGV